MHGDIFVGFKLYGQYLCHIYINLL